jgi:hypothetical protein
VTLYNTSLTPKISGEGEGNVLATSGNKCLERFAAFDYHARRLSATFLQPVAELTAKAAAPSVNVAID